MQQTPPNYTETKRVRAVKIYSERIFEVCAGDAPIADIDTTYWQLRVEPVPADDVEAEQRCAAVGAEPVLALFSHSKEVEGATDGQLEDYGDPLALIVHPDDTLEQARERYGPAFTEAACLGCLCLLCSRAVADAACCACYVRLPWLTVFADKRKS